MIIRSVIVKITWILELHVINTAYPCCIFIDFLYYQSQQNFLVAYLPMYCHLLYVSYFMIILGLLLLFVSLMLGGLGYYYSDYIASKSTGWPS